MNEEGRFNFDQRPRQFQEIARLETLDHFYQKHTKKVLDLVSQKRKIKNIIDIGGGTGDSVILIKKLFPKAKVTYFDKSEVLKKYAKKKIVKAGYDVEFINHDILNYEFQNKYDLVFSKFAVKHFFNPQKSIKKLTKILSKFGQICIIEKDILANIWYPCFPLYKTKFLNALNSYNSLESRGGDVNIGRKIRNILELNDISVSKEQLFFMNMNEDSEEIETYKKCFVEVYENLIPELVNNDLITKQEAERDIEKLKKFINNKKNTSIIIDFAIIGQKDV